jgi:hypothetical protein
LVEVAPIILVADVEKRVQKGLVSSLADHGFEMAEVEIVRLKRSDHGRRWLDLASDSLDDVVFLLYYDIIELPHGISEPDHDSSARHSKLI